jgi:hypothetical protein
MAQGEGPEFKPQYHKQTKQNSVTRSTRPTIPFPYLALRQLFFPEALGYEPLLGS